MAFDFSTLITDRAQSDLDALRDLLATPMADWTAEQLAAFNQAVSKGAYNYTDLNRVIAAMDDLNERLTAAGYETGYRRIQVPRQDGESRLPQGYTELLIAGPEVAQSESSYTQIEWLGFSGAQYIDTGLRGTQNTRFITRFRNDQTPNSAIFGADGGWQINGFGVWVNPTIIAPVFGSQTGSIGLTFGSELDEIQLDSTGVRFNGSQVWSVSGATPFTTPTNLAIGAVNRAGTIYEQFVGRIGKTKIEESGNTVREYVPVRNPDGALGMYDTINNVFVPNSGSGVFSSGPVVPGSPDLPEPEPGPDPYTWYESDTPTASLMDVYLSNVSALRAVLDLPETTPEVPADMDRLTQAEANAIEDILGIIHTYLLALQSILRRCGAVVCGGPELYFVN